MLRWVDCRLPELPKEVVLHLHIADYVRLFEDSVQLKINTLVVVCPPSSWQSGLHQVLAEDIALRFPILPPSPSRFLQNGLPLHVLQAFLWNSEVSLRHRRTLVSVEHTVLLRTRGYPRVVIFVALDPCVPPKIIMRLPLYVLIQHVSPTVLHSRCRVALRHIRVLVILPRR
jgi:hypothetical protein